MSTTAVVLVLSAAVAHAGWNILAHGASRTGLLFLWCGSVASTLIWLPVIPLTGGLDTDDLRAFGVGIGVSAVLHVAYMIVLQRGYAAGNLSTVYAVARGSGPLLTVVVAVGIWQESVGVVALLGVAAIILGVVAIGLVDRGGAADGRLRLSLVYGSLTGVAIAAYTLWDAASLRDTGASPVAYMVGCTALEIPFFTMLLRRELRGAATLVRQEWKRILAFAVLSPLSYILVLSAVTIAPVALVAPMREVSVVLVSLFGAFVLRENRPARRVAASVVVLAGIVMLAT
ncbi:EamA family transporter [Aeromicrobium sp. Leaf350]|uniref:EamA family transporter n=1 Tax=Aeromicrobium sp. Leaf350 TaxID=2876565 RepID=UPI001E38B579|nr:EamA family transporter [Aeromicrobium sp. Leaf350]